ncbi:hypothetical protein CU048_04195 [Beijerinckiaceae bacterium]|nr:hypothetical protein CU048_04195 [Beijerinckiaceae bacterium]
MIASRPISEDNLHAYVDKLLDRGRHAEVEAYLEQHPDVARRVQGFISQREMLRSAFLPIGQEPVPPELSLRRLIEAKRRPPANAWRSSWRSAVAASVLLAAGGAAGWFGHGMSPDANRGIATLAQEALANYEVYAPDRFRPVEIKAADSGELVRWVSQRLQHPIAAPDLTASGYRFMGGRLVATAHGPAGLLMYDDDHGTRLVMLVRPMEIEKNTMMSQYANGRATGFAWARDGIGYSLVGAAAPEVLHPLADEIRRQTAKDV